MLSFSNLFESSFDYESNYKRGDFSHGFKKRDAIRGGGRFLGHAVGLSAGAIGGMAATPAFGPLAIPVGAIVGAGVGSSGGAMISDALNKDNEKADLRKPLHRMGIVTDRAMHPARLIGGTLLSPLTLGLNVPVMHGAYTAARDEGYGTFGKIASSVFAPLPQLTTPQSIRDFEHKQKIKNDE